LLSSPSFFILFFFSNGPHFTFVSSFPPLFSSQSQLIPLQQNWKTKSKL
jgi:hypothetical protein